jgi:hypothetical protein
MGLCPGRSFVLRTLTEDSGEFMKIRFRRIRATGLLVALLPMALV